MDLLSWIRGHGLAAIPTITPFYRIGIMVLHKPSVKQSFQARFATLLYGKTSTQLGGDLLYLGLPLQLHFRLLKARFTRQIFLQQRFNCDQALQQLIFRQ